MALTDTFVSQVKPNAIGIKKYQDGDGMYLLVKPAGKYWRFDYSFNGKRKTAALGTYPEVSLAKAQQRRQEAREQIADGIDPSAAKRNVKAEKILRERQSFSAITHEWLEKTEALRAEPTQVKVTAWLTRNVLPFIGTIPVSEIKARDVLLAVQRVEARGAIESAHRVKQLCGDARMRRIFMHCTTGPVSWRAGIVMTCGIGPIWQRGRLSVRGWLAKSCST